MYGDTANCKDCIDVSKNNSGIIDRYGGNNCGSGECGRRISNGRNIVGSGVIGANMDALKHRCGAYAIGITRNDWYGSHDNNSNNEVWSGGNA